MASDDRQPSGQRGAPPLGTTLARECPFLTAQAVWEAYSRSHAQASLIVREALFWWIMKGHCFLKLLLIVLLWWFDGSMCLH